jgi:cytoskeletal protein CcmA (bactofilin family)
MQDSAASKQETVIGKDDLIEGTFTIKNALRVEGHIKGQVTCNDVVTVGADGVVDGNIQGKDVVISGRINGSVQAGELVTLLKSASLDGDIVTKRLMIEEGAKFEGTCSMSGKKASPQPTAGKSTATPPAPENNPLKL